MLRSALYVKGSDLGEHGTPISNSSRTMHISIVEDEKMLANNVLKKLQNQGYAASAFYGYESFMREWDAHSQLYIIDISLGDGSGFDIVKWLRQNQWTKVPIMIISGYADSQNIVYGLDIGADDYLTKPFVPEELLARVKAMLRRPNDLVTQPVMRHKDIVFNKDTKEVTIDGKKIYLTRNESLILELFLSNPGKTVSRNQLIDDVWGGCKYASISDNTINVTLSNVRRKLGPNFKLKTIYNYWYVLE